MSVVTSEGPEEFRVGMLWRDTRYRSYTFQIIALIAVMLIGSFLVTNIVSNLRDAGKDFNFSFLWEPASYDINQKLIEYTSRAPHWKAALVGILNTLLVAVLGCVTATVIGVFAGVLRLSKNWLISKIMSAYVEVARNVPVLLQILLVNSVFIGLLPKPKLSDPMLGGALVATNRGFYIPSVTTEAGSWLVFLVFCISVVGVFVLRRYAKRQQEQTGKRLPVGMLSLGILIVPALLAFFAAGMPLGLEYPELKGFNYKGGIHMRISLVALWLALSIYTGAFIAENVRAGIQAISKGQSEAAHALGLRSARTMRLIVLPQALRIIIPPMISNFLNLTKNSSLAIAVGYMDVTGTLGGITLNQTGRAMECVLLLMAFYLVTSLSISAAMNKYNHMVRIRGR
ncbi:amino acid ABC transporter permease [Polycladidibacter stylochi]|uniref:amino acid ABC transporter permease n=1 Tax=Polycladidibacter stylochi TaxID=1807766 RepID=UPI00083697A2|nr:ABC transporter permease subunit [Pseudovibrio stylochi]